MKEGETGGGSMGQTFCIFSWKGMLEERREQEYFTKRAKRSPPKKKTLLMCLNNPLSFFGEGAIDIQLQAATK